MLNLKIKRLSGTAKLPTREHDGDMWDLYADRDVEIHSYKATIVPLGIAVEIPTGYRLKVYSRSSLPLKMELNISNGVGVIDTGYKNEIGLICQSIPDIISQETLDFINYGGVNPAFFEDMLVNNIVQINKGDKVAQFQLEKIVDFDIQEVEDIDMSNDRGGGFGSTNKEQ